MRVLPFMTVAAIVLVHGCGLEPSGTLSPQPDSGAPADAAPDVVKPVLDAGGDVVEQLDSSPDGNVVDSGTEANCLDGIDNDGDGKIDCADPDCSPIVQCVPTAPAGWNGPALYFDARTACPAAFPGSDDLSEDFAPGNATCSSCSCVATGSTCQLPIKIRCRDDVQCDQTPQIDFDYQNGSCITNIFGTELDNKDHCRLEAPTVTPGSCNASGGQVSKQQPQFLKQSRMCRSAVTGGGCAGGQACVARPTAHGYCVSRQVPDGQSAPACPTGFDQAHTASRGNGSFNDARGCTACSCGGQAPQNPVCTAQSQLFTSLDCSGAAASTILGNSTCQQVVNQETTIRSGRLVTTVTQGICAIAPTGGTVTGSVTPTSVTQVCCQN